MSDVTIPGGKIRAFVERIENLDTEIRELNEQKKEVFAEAKGDGFDVKSSKRSSNFESRTRTSATSVKACSISICARWSWPCQKKKSQRLRDEAGRVSQR
jgi:uncharacterized protein (UPF0335 family)